MSRITLEEDLDSGPGWVLLTVTPPVSPEISSVAFTRRQSDKSNLGKNGWQAKPAILTARLRSEETGFSIFRFGPEVTDHISVDQNVTVSIPDTGIAERHFWPAIPPAPKDSGLGIGLPSVPSELKTLAKGRTTDNSKPDPTDDAVKIEDPVDPGEEPKGWLQKWWWIILLAILLILAAGAFYYFKSQPEPTPEPPVLEEPEPEPEPVIVESEPVLPTMMERFEAYRDEGGHAADLYALGLEAMEEGEDEVGFQAIILASDRGSAEANMHAGRWYDSGSVTITPVGPNANTAARYFSKARDAGSTEADQALQELCAAAEVAADNEPAALLSESHEIYCE